MAIPPTAYVPVGSEFQDGRPLGNRVRFNGEGGIRKEWWWQAGPVDSCCCCCTLPAGVAVLAAMSFLGGFSSFVTMCTRAGTTFYQEQAAMLEKQYVDVCEGVNQQSPICPLLATNAVNAEMLNEMTVLFFAQALLGTVAGAVGIWAVVTHNARGAKLFLWSSLPQFSVDLVVIAIRRRRAQQYDLPGFWYSITAGDILSLVLCAYYVKVMWSYHATLKRRDRAAAAAASASAGSIELDGVHSTVV
eukprot:g2172.t1